MSRIDLLELTPDALVALVEEWGEPAYRGRQLAVWIYRKNVVEFDAMSNLPRSLRARLSAEAEVRVPEVTRALRSRDGSEKLELRLLDGRSVQSVLMPDQGRLTLCLSTQVGCGFGCTFCLTGTMGLVRNLTAGEIVGQVLAARRRLGVAERPGVRPGTSRAEQLTHVVFMGMGEPLANYRATTQALRTLLARDGLGFSPRRLTVSTVGLVSGIERLAREGLKVNLAVSLHAPTDPVRTRLMPVNRGWGIDDLLAACRRFPLPARQRMTFEYVLLEEVNDRPEDARLLARRLAGIRAKVNLIPFNTWLGSGFRRPSTERIAVFQRMLRDAGITATVRWSKGEDVGAACGQLHSAPDEDVAGGRVAEAG